MNTQTYEHPPKILFFSIYICVPFIHKIISNALYLSLILNKPTLWIFCEQDRVKKKEKEDIMSLVSYPSDV
jgi:hypothetical protein